jgi:hypothetical protein
MKNEFGSHCGGERMATSKKSFGSGPIKPEDIQRHFADAMTFGKIDAVLALYEPGATLVVPPSGPAVTGLAAIRDWSLCSP